MTTHIITVAKQGNPGPTSTTPGPVGPSGPNGILGQVTNGLWTPIDNGADWVSVPAGTTAVVYTLPNGVLLPGEFVDVYVDVAIQQVGGAAFDRFNRTIAVQNNAGVITTPNGGTTDVDLTATPHSSALSGLAVSLVITAGTIGVQVTSPTGIAIVAGVSGSFNRRLAPGTAIVPVVTSVSVGAGPNTGGTITVLTGLHFATPGIVTAVSLDGVPVASFHVDSDTQITCTSAVTATPGTGNVLASNNVGGTPLVNGWQYTQGTVPVVLSASPASATQSGGVAVTLTGQHFLLPLPVTTVTLDGVAVTIVAVDSDTSMRITTTSTVVSGTGNILATSTAGGAPLVGGWTWIGPPVLTAMVLDIGVYEGGSTASGTGTGLQASGFTFDGVAATAVVIGNNGTTFSCTVPAMTGPNTTTHGAYVSVQATNSAGSSNILSSTAGFFYLPSVTIEFHNPRFGTTPAAPTNGASLTAWLGAANTGASQIPGNGAASDPTYVSASGVNGQPAIRTSNNGGPGSAAQYWKGTFAATQSLTAFTMMIIGIESGGAGAYPGNIIEMDPNAALLGASLVPDINLASVFATTYMSGSSGPLGNILNPGIVVGTPFIISSRWTGTQVFNRTAGADGLPGSWSTSPIPGLTNYSIGNAQGTGLAQFDTVFAIFASKAYVTADFTGLSLYTNHKFGLAA